MRKIFLAMLLSAATASAAPWISMNTNYGEIVIELDEVRAPETVDNFIKYVNSGFYDGTIFHRVIAGFMIQGGGFTADFQQKPTRSPIASESQNGLKNQRATIAMARTNDPHSATAQFFINVVDNDALNPNGADKYGYTVFGAVKKGMDVVDKIAQMPTGAGGIFEQDVPQSPVLIEKVRVIDAPDAKN